MITSFAHQLLKNSKQKAENFKNYHAAEYDKFFPVIVRVYSEVYYWHGTGRYHYSHSSDSRYDGKSTTEYIDLLQSIIDNGLTPHFDPWIKVGENYIKTISLTRCRMHARLYSDTHRYEKDAIMYEFGTTRYWLFLLITLVTLAIIRHPTKSARDFVKVLMSKPSLERGRTWVQAIRKDISITTLGFWKMFEAKSDISSNYPIIFGIRNLSDTLPVSPFMDKFETRTSQCISLDKITHIEVPLSKVKEVEKFLVEKNITLVVIPLEMAEIYCSQFLTQDLIYNPELSEHTAPQKKLICKYTFLLF